MPPLYPPLGDPADESDILPAQSEAMQGETGPLCAILAFSSATLGFPPPEHPRPGLERGTWVGGPCHGLGRILSTHTPPTPCPRTVCPFGSCLGERRRGPERSRMDACNNYPASPFKESATIATDTCSVPARVRNPARRRCTKKFNLFRASDSQTVLPW